MEKNSSAKLHARLLSIELSEFVKDPWYWPEAIERFFKRAEKDQLTPEDTMWALGWAADDLRDNYDLNHPGNTIRDDEGRRLHEVLHAAQDEYADEYRRSRGA